MNSSVASGVETRLTALEIVTTSASWMMSDTQPTPADISCGAKW